MLFPRSDLREGLISPIHPDIRSRRIDSDTQKLLRQASQAGAVGLEVVLAVVLGLWGGEALDQRFGTAPTFKIVLLVLAATAVVRSLMRITRQYLKDNPTHPDDGKPPPQA